jgi:uncharacterized protein
LSSAIAFASGSRRLAGHLFAPTEGTASGIGLLFVHGSDSSQLGYHERAAAATERLGATCLTFDLSGHGASEGSWAVLSVRDHLEDCEVSFDRLAREAAVNPARIGVCGASYGGHLAAMLTASRAPGSLLMRAPALYPDSELERRGGPQRSSTETSETTAALRDLARYDGPALVVESEHDELIPHGIVEAYLSACRHGRREVIRDIGHTLDDARSRARFVALIVAWFGETLPLRSER